jgi:hypothetical protein
MTLVLPVQMAPPVRPAPPATSWRRRDSAIRTFYVGVTPVRESLYPGAPWVVPQ